jgi:L-ribulose-5-phosphate 3-epimerase
MKKAINAWSVPPGESFEAMFESVSEAGFDAIELNVDREGHSAHSLPLAPRLDLCALIRELSQKYNLPVCSISTSLYGGTLGSPDQASRDRAKRLLSSQLEWAAALGAGAILAVPGGIGDDVSIARAWEVAAQGLRDMLATIADSGVRVGLENVWNGFFTSPMEMARFIDELGSPAVGAYFDVGNVAVLSPPEYWIEILGARIVRVHVKDFLRAGGYRGYFVNLLEGSIRWDRVVASLRAAGFDGCLTAELPVMPHTPDYLYRSTSDALDVIISL